MKRRRFTEDQIIGILKEHEAGVSVADLCRKHGVSDATVYKWKAKYSGMDVSEAKRLKGLEDARLNRLLADTILYNSAQKELAGLRRRFGYRRLHVFLRREGHEVNHKRLFRIYREEWLHVRRRRGRKRAIGTRTPMPLPLMPNKRWSLDFVSHQLTDGRRYRVLTAVDDCTRECLALIADTSLSGARVARELATLFEARGKPITVVSDNGTEFTSNAILTFAEDL